MSVAVRSGRWQTASWGAALTMACGPAVYAAIRWIEARANREPDPAAVIWAEHSALLTRTWLAGYVLAAVLTASLAFASRWASHCERAVRWALGTSAVVVAAQIAFWP